jgi:hypothetical protein
MIITRLWYLTTYNRVYPKKLIINECTILPSKYQIRICHLAMRFYHFYRQKL